MSSRRLSRIHSLAIPALLLALSAGAARAQQPAAAPERIGLAERAWIASKIYSSVQLYFGHWQAVPELDLDAAYRQYLDKALASDDRMAFDLASMEFLAKLENGHSGFWDSWLNEREKPLGFALAPSGEPGKETWTVVRSRGDGLAPGDVVRALDGRAIGDFVADRLRYVSGSSLAGRRRSLFFARYLFPRAFTLTLEDGRAVRIDREHQQLRTPPDPVQEGKVLGGGVAFLRIPSFERLEDEKAAVEFVRAHAAAPALVIDVRGNGGGTTPSLLIRALMDRPYRGFNNSTSSYVALFGAYAKVLQDVPADQMDERQRGSLEATAGLARQEIVFPGSLNPPDKPLYTGPLIVLSDGGCGSSCEDFLMPLKVSGRARIVGEASTGSTGQPYYHEFGNGMGFRVSSKRTSFPDGSQFEGVGIRPDVEVRPTVDDLRKGADPALERALALAREGAAAAAAH